jgi:hypothetical protein
VAALRAASPYLSRTIVFKSPVLTSSSSIKNC